MKRKCVLSLSSKPEKKIEGEISSPTTTTTVLSSPAASTISSLTASSLASVVRRQQNNSSNHIIGRQQNSILNFFPKIDASRDFVKDPLRPVNIKSPELMSCEKEILDSHRTAELIQKRRKIKSLAISEGKMKKKNRIVAETILGRSVFKSKRNTFSSAVKKQIVGHM
jgi:hypothetical protein